MLSAHQPTRLSSGVASDTARRVAELRAVDAMAHPARRLLNDQYARLFFPGESLPATPEAAMEWLFATDREYRGFPAVILLRQRCFEDYLVRAAEAGVRQAVLLGAGYDTTALRLTQLRSMGWFEVDHPATQRYKLASLDEAGVTAPSVTYVPMDFESGRSLEDALAAAGFVATEPCVVGWLGVAFFLRPEAFRHTLRMLSAFCATGSTLVFDYMDQSVLDGTTPYRSAIRTSQEVGAKGEPYLTGLTPKTADAALQAVGFRAMEQLRTPDLVKRYGRSNPYCSDDDFMGVIAAERQ